MGVAESGTLGGAIESGKLGFRQNDRRRSTPGLHAINGRVRPSVRPDDCLCQITLQAPASGCLGFASCSRLCGHCFPKAIKDACGIFVSRGELKGFPRTYCPSAPLTFPDSSHHQPSAASGLLPTLLPPSFFSLYPLLPFSCMPDIVPSTPGGGGAQPLLQSTTSSINAQFLNAVTRGDEPYARSLLARGADVNATDATGRSAVASVLAGERCATARVSG